MLVKTYGSVVYGIDAITITIEVNVSKGVKFFLVGLPDNAVKESQRRIEAALKNIGYRKPGKRITVNMAPADIKKEGSAYDLPIAIGILAASGQMDYTAIDQYMIMGELSLDGGIQPVKGALSMAYQAKKEGFKGIILPRWNIEEAGVIDGIEVLGAENLLDVIHFFDVNEPLKKPQIKSGQLLQQNNLTEQLDFADVKGQENVKRAMEIAAAGGHNIIMIGPPGVGKTMIAKRLPTILPAMTMEEALETTKIHSVAGVLGNESRLLINRPFRSPHHTISDVALVGGGSVPRPGEISLSHNGILFLDELPEFKRTVLEVMRQPLEDRVVTISRAKIAVDFPANFMLVASMNPSPSGDFYNPETSSDSEFAVKRYLNKVSGPLMDRIDLHVEVAPVPFDKLSTLKEGEPSRSIRERVNKARAAQHGRFQNTKGVYSNAQLTPKLIKQYCRVDSGGKALLKNAVEHLGFSARSYARILKVARTIADLDHQEHIRARHIGEAIQYRSLDRDGWI